MHNALSLRRATLIALLAAFAALAGVFTMPVLDSDEARYAQASAQMLESGDYLHIRFLDKARNVKPAGIYWLQAASVRLFGQTGTRQIWAFRLPSVFGVVLAALALYWGGCALAGERTAFWGALLFAPSLLLASEGGIAKTDAMLVGLTTLAMAALARLRHNGARREALIFWGAVGAGILVKGPVTPLIAALALFILWRWERDAKWMRSLTFWPGPLLAFLMVGPWLVLMQMGTHGAFLRDAVGGDLLPKLWHAKNGHWGFPGQHIVTLVLMLFPAVVFLPAGIMQLWDGRKKDRYKALPDWHFLVAWVAPWWLIVEMIPTKLVHYPLPIYPGLALVAGLGVCALEKTRWPVLAGVVLALLAPFVIAALMVMLMHTSGLAAAQNTQGLLVALAPAFGFAAAAGWALLRHRGRTSAVLLVLSALAVHIAARTVVLPSLKILAPSQQLASLLQTKGLLPANIQASSVIAVSGLSLPSLAFLTGGRVDFTTAQGAARALAQGHTVLIEKRQRPAFDAWLKVLSSHGVTVGTVEGYNYTKGQSVSIAILVPGKDAKRDTPHH